MNDLCRGSLPKVLNKKTGVSRALRLMCSLYWETYWGKGGGEGVKHETLWLGPQDVSCKKDVH